MGHRGTPPQLVSNSPVALSVSLERSIGWSHTQRAQTGSEDQGGLKRSGEEAGPRPAVPRPWDAARQRPAKRPKRDEGDLGNS